MNGLEHRPRFRMRFGTLEEGLQCSNACRKCERSRQLPVPTSRAEPVLRDQPIPPPIANLHINSIIKYKKQIKPSLFPFFIKKMEVSTRWIFGSKKIRWAK